MYSGRIEGSYHVTKDGKWYIFHCGPSVGVVTCIMLNCRPPVIRILPNVETGASEDRYFPSD